MRLWVGVVGSFSRSAQGGGLPWRPVAAHWCALGLVMALCRVAVWRSFGRSRRLLQFFRGGGRFTSTRTPIFCHCLRPWPSSVCVQIGPFERLHAPSCRAPSGWGAGASSLCMGRALWLIAIAPQERFCGRWVACLLSCWVACLCPALVRWLGRCAACVLTACEAPSGEWGQSILGSPLQISPHATWDACLLVCLPACLACTRWPGSGRRTVVPEVLGQWLPTALGRVL